MPIERERGSEHPPATVFEVRDCRTELVSWRCLCCGSCRDLRPCSGTRKKPGSELRRRKHAIRYESFLRHRHRTRGCDLKRVIQQEVSGKLLFNNPRTRVTTQSGSTIQLRNIVRIVGWNELATHAAKVAKSGSRVVIEGRLHVAKWEGKNGQKNVAYEVHLIAPLKPFQATLARRR
jgi:hypothetical protein